MLYIRCLESDINSWNMTHEGWTWRNVLSTYKSIENYTPREDPYSPSGIPSYHGTGGLLAITTSRPDTVDPIAAEFISSSVHAGLKLVEDFNSPGPGDRVGVGYYDFNIDNGVRDSAAHRFLSPLLNRATQPLDSSAHSNSPSMEPNGDLHRPQDIPYSISRHLTLAHHATVDKILLQPTGGGTGPLRAVGVEYMQYGVRKRAFLQANQRGRYSPIHESIGVIVTAGALLTPKLLMRSGIGPAEELRKANIPVHVDSPGVGANLQDHPAIGMLFKVQPSLAASKPCLRRHTHGCVLVPR